MKNLGLKIVSVVLAAVVWSAVAAPRRGRAVERALSASVSLVAMPRDFIITTPTTVPDKVTLRLRGRKSDLDALTSRALEATVDLNWLQQSGEATITLRPQAFNVPADVDVVSIDPNQFRFRVEELRQGTVKIRPFLLGNVPDGYLVGEVKVDPERALVSGPATQITKMGEIGTDRIIMTGRIATFTQSVAVLSDSSLVRVISPVTAQVTVPIIGEIGPTLPPVTGTAGEQQSAPAPSGERSTAQQ